MVYLSLLNFLRLILFLGLITIFHNSYANYAIVDFSKSSLEKRLNIYSDSGKLLFSTYTAHGSGSGGGTYPTHFSNVEGSHASSLGTYKIGEVHYGKNGKGYRMHGLDKSNSRAYERYILVHGANYIGNGRSGTSWGCFAVPYKDLNMVMILLTKGDILVARR